MAIRLEVPESLATLLLMLLPLFAALLYFRTVEAWPLCLLQRAVQRLQAG